MGVCGFSRFGFNQPPGLPETCLFKDVLLRWDGNGACLGLPRAPELQRVSLSDVLCQNAFGWSMVLCLCMVFGSSSIDPQVFLEMVRLRWCTHLLNRHTKQHERGSHLFQLAPRTQSALWAVPPLRLATVVGSNVASLVSPRASGGWWIQSVEAAELKITILLQIWSSEMICW